MTDSLITKNGVIFASYEWAAEVKTGSARQEGQFSHKNSEGIDVLRELSSSRCSCYSISMMLERDRKLMALGRLLVELLDQYEEELDRKIDEGSQYAFFENADERNELVHYCERVTEYLHDNGIADLIIIDRSSRPLYIGVMELWRHKYPGQPMPGIYFMNPKGFKDTDTLTDDDLFDIEEDSAWNEDRLESIGQARASSEIRDELERTYVKLMRDKDKPVLVFDSCIHSGDTLTPVVESLEELDFSDVRIGSVEEAPPRANIHPDFYITDTRPAKGCYPFDQDKMIEKTFDHVYSYPQRDPALIKRSTQLRKEIKQIITEAINNRKE